MRRIRFIVKKEFLQMLRDPNMLRLLFLMPIVQLLLLGYVVSSEVKHIRTVICDLDNSPVSREIIEKMRHSDYFMLTDFEKHGNALYRYLDTGKASVVVVFPRNLARNLMNRRQSQIQILMDGVDSNTSTLALGYVEGILQNFLEDYQTRQQQKMGSTTNIRRITPIVRVWYNPELKYKNFMIPALIATLLTMVTAMVSAMGLVREREIGTLDQLMVSPIKKYELLIGKIIPFATVGFIVVTVAILFAKLWYRIPIVGNLGLFALFVSVYLFTTLGIGLFVSASVRTQQQAMFMTFFFIFFFMLMSGFMFQIENMPKAAQILSYLDPLRYLIVVVREIFIKGADLRHLYKQGIALVLFGGTIFTFAVIRFQKRMK